MRSDTIAGLVILGLSLITGGVTYGYVVYTTADRKAAMQSAGMAAGILLTAGALLPQAIRNEEDPKALETAFSPFLLSTGGRRCEPCCGIPPLTLTLRVPGPAEPTRVCSKGGGGRVSRPSLTGCCGAGLFPVAVIIKLPGEFRVLHNADPKEHLIVLLQLLGLLMILVLYDVFMIQYASATTDKGVEAGFIFLSTMYVLVTAGAFFVALDARWREHLLVFTGY